MSLTLKRFLVRATLGVFAGARVIGIGLWRITRPILWRPLGALGQGVFRIVLLPAYGWYSRRKNSLKSNPRFSGISSAAHFVERYALYAGLVLLGTLGLAGNLFARTVRPDEIGQGTIWGAFVQTEYSDIIIDTKVSTKATGSTDTKDAVGSVLTTAAPATRTEADIFAIDDASMVGAIGGSTPTAEIRRTTVVYDVQGGDTLSTIAVRFGVSSSSIRWANGLGSSDLIKPGQALRIPPVSGVLYTVKSGDTLAGIANKFSGDQQQILDQNGLLLADNLHAGEEIVIPGGHPPAEPAPVVPPSQSPGRGTIGSVTAPPSVPATGADFIWPSNGHHINQYFRGRIHTGIDIEGNYSSPIYAAAAGRVIYSGFDRSGYGLHVVIDHGNGYRTMYAHASKVFVSNGDYVKQGKTIAMVGSTGRSTGTHLHYEIRTSGGFANPLAFY